VFNTYSFNLGPAPQSADGITFKGYSVIGRDVELLGESSILFEQMGALNSKVLRAISLNSLPGKTGQTTMIARCNCSFVLVDPPQGSRVAPKEKALISTLNRAQDEAMLDEIDEGNWSIQVTLRAGVGMPLNNVS